MAEFVPFWQQPSLPDRLKVVKGAEAFSAAAYSLISLPAGAFFAKIERGVATTAPATTYTSVADGESSRIELNSDLVYCNHSCDPSLVFDMTKFEVRVSDKRPLQEGDALTFFYPSTEWTMVQPFACACESGKDRCLGFISGSSQIEPSILSRYWLNDHIHRQLDEKLRSEELKARVDAEARGVASDGLTA